MTESPFSHVENIKPATTPDNASVAVADMFSASTVETPEVVDPIVNDSPNFEQPVEEVKVEEVVVEETVAEVDETPAEDVDPVVAFADSLRLQAGDWFVIHSYAGLENRVKTNIENRIISLNMED